MLTRFWPPIYDAGHEGVQRKQAGLRRLEDGTCPKPARENVDPDRYVRSWIIQDPGPTLQDPFSFAHKTVFSVFEDPTIRVSSYSDAPPRSRCDFDTHGLTEYVRCVAAAVHVRFDTFSGDEAADTIRLQHLVASSRRGQDVDSSDSDVPLFASLSCAYARVRGDAELVATQLDGVLEALHAIREMPVVHAAGLPLSCAFHDDIQNRAEAGVASAMAFLSTHSSCASIFLSFCVTHTATHDAVAFGTAQASLARWDHVVESCVPEIERRTALYEELRQSCGLPRDAYGNVLPRPDIWLAGVETRTRELLTSPCTWYPNARPHDVHAVQRQLVRDSFLEAATCHYLLALSRFSCLSSDEASLLLPCCVEAWAASEAVPTESHHWRDLMI